MSAEFSDNDVIELAVNTAYRIYKRGKSVVVLLFRL